MTVASLFLDVDECATDNGNCPHKCVDLPIGHRCDCRRGYEFDPTSKMCLDVNECHIFGKCSQNCHNLKGSFECSCKSGYSMASSMMETSTSTGGISLSTNTRVSDNRTCYAEGKLSFTLCAKVLLCFKGLYSKLRGFSVYFPNFSMPQNSFIQHFNSKAHFFPQK